MKTSIDCSTHASAARPTKAARHWSRAALAAATVGLLAVGFGWFFAARGGPPEYTVKVVNTFPHDRNAFCQGLECDDGALLEGTGQFGESTLRRVELTSGRVLQSIAHDRRVFGEGVTRVGDRIYQLTWQNRTCFVFDATTLRQVGRFTYNGEGWGLAHDDKHLIMSNGSSQLQFRDPQTFAVVKTLWVKSQGRPVTKLNELEYVDGEIYANIWHQDVVARIDPESGEVTGWIDMASLFPARLRPHREAVLNGIAYDAAAKRLFVTGKHWPQVFEVELTPK
ncbi:MAG: glutaminyl-peptide cyclotransferase [Planctomycetales bacterium]|nr:glutaminyl-peptide cyclotransferase [Planctomycetales bacterium]